MTPETSPLVPETFGPLQGVKILSSGTIIAQPFAALLAAEMGAEVIQIERPGQGDQVWRNLEFPLEGPGGVKTASAWVQERRNMFHVSLDLSKPRGKELFLQLAARSDIWMESSKPGAYQKWGSRRRNRSEGQPEARHMSCVGLWAGGPPRLPGPRLL